MVTTDGKTLAGTYKDERSAISAVRRLREMGYKAEDISILAKDPERFPELYSSTGVSQEGGTPVTAPVTSPDGTVGGAITGGVIGGLGGLLLSLGALAIPGVGPIIAAGPLAATLGGALAGGTFGGFVGALTDLGVDETLATEYDQNLQAGDILVLTRADAERESRVRDVFATDDTTYYGKYGKYEGEPYYSDSRYTGPKYYDKEGQSHDTKIGRDLDDGITNVKEGAKDIVDPDRDGDPLELGSERHNPRR